MRTRSLFPAVAFSLVLLAVAAPAFGAIGQSAESIATDRQLLSAARLSTAAHQGFEVHEYQSRGTAVREYLSPSGQVFAVAWNGYSHPDLAVLLGDYVAEYRAALNATPLARGRRQRHVTTQHLVVDTWGHMRNLQGRAYAPDLVPPGVNIDEIR